MPNSQGRDTIIDIDDDGSAAGFANGPFRGSPRSPVLERDYRRRSGPADDVCVPFDALTEAGDEEDDDYLHRQESEALKPKRSRKRQWPDLDALDEWCAEEKEERMLEGVRAKRVSEPMLIGGRLRPQVAGWHRDDDEEPFRWTYFNEELDSSLRSHSLSELQGLDYNFRQLFIPDPPELEEDSSSDEDEDISPTRASVDRSATPVNGSSRGGTRQSSLLDHKGFEAQSNGHTHKSSGDNTPRKPHSREPKPKRYGPRPVFWLDVLQPTYDEMRILSRAFGIHKLTAEDIMEQEAREKVELFRNYYFVNYRTFEQDPESEDFMEPVNMYFVVFKGGVLSFHFSPMPHPANVRRRIRQLAEHQYTDSDWISYAIIDNITDAYAPVIEQIEREVDNIDDDILRMHAKNTKDEEKRKIAEKTKKKKGWFVGWLNSEYEGVQAEDEAHVSGETGKDMLLRVGECRKKVMSLYRLLGNKADVIKGLAKRCNEQWQVAPTSDVGLYLGDIQDHIVTMTGSLTHYEK
jgi:magnesium transporter